MFKKVGKNKVRKKRFSFKKRTKTGATTFHPGDKRPAEDISKNKMFIRSNASYLTQQYYFEEEFVKDCFKSYQLEDSDVHNCLLLLGLIASESDFQSFGEVKISQLSGGERQRLAIATEFLKRKTLYLLDEITSALDQQHENLVAEFINKNSSSKLIIVVTHSKNFAEKFNHIINLDICD